LPTSIASGQYYIQVGQPGNSTYGYLEPVQGSDGQFYLGLVQQVTGPWIYTNVSTDQLQNTLQFSKNNLWLGVHTQPNSSGNALELIPMLSTIQGATNFGWVLTNQNSGQIFYTRGPNGQNCLTLQSLQGYGYILGPCFPGSNGSPASGFTFVTGGNFGCTPIN
jgi:hypothetical protein